MKVFAICGLYGTICAGVQCRVIAKLLLERNANPIKTDKYGWDAHRITDAFNRINNLFDLIKMRVVKMYFIP